VPEHWTTWNQHFKQHNCKIIIAHSKDCLFNIHSAGQHSCSVMVSFPVEEDTNQGSNPGGRKKSPSLATQKIVAGRWPVAPAVGLGPPTRGEL
jgi:hypothetical protein